MVRTKLNAIQGQFDDVSRLLERDMYTCCRGKGSRFVLGILDLVKAKQDQNKLYSPFTYAWNILTVSMLVVIVPHI